MRERLPHWLARLPLSLAIHVAVIAAIAAVVRMEPAPPALFIDLKEIIAGGTEEGAAGGDGSMAGAGAASGAAPAP
ncbi:MAG: hypothetical protein FJ027_23100, partial [Candidatus Rokubacteria bacterium]|nr:hypothetical protein [Candidatus Rokubacteria bacterium]